MKLQYLLHDMSYYNQAKCMGDLMRYYGESKFKLLETINKICTNETIAIKLLNTIRKHTGMAGLTIDSLVDGLQTSASMDIFKYKVNGKNPCDIFASKDVKLEVYMNPIFFATEASLNLSLPGFRKHKSMDMEERVKELTIKKRNDWVRWFEKELNNYHSHKLWKKTVLELD